MPGAVPFICSSIAADIFQIVSLVNPVDNGGHEDDHIQVDVTVVVIRILDAVRQTVAGMVSYHKVITTSMLMLWHHYNAVTVIILRRDSYGVIYIGTVRRDC